MHDSAIQHYWKLVVGRLYHIVPWLGGRMHCHAAIIAVEQSVRRLVQQEAEDGICRLPDVWKRVLHFGGDYL